MGTLGWEHWYGNIGMGALAWEHWHGSIEMEARVCMSMSLFLFCGFPGRGCRTWGVVIMSGAWLCLGRGCACDGDRKCIL